MLRFFMKRKKYKYVNGIKGAISLFLILILAPFLMCITVIIDTARIYSSRTTVQEIMGIAGLSTLGNYDTYLQQRFGLYAVDQVNDIETIVKSYVDSNKTLAKDVNISNLQAVGQYSLTDNEILYNQVMEYCKLNAPTELAKDLSQIEEFVKKMEDQLGVMKNVLKMLTSISNMLGSMKDFAKAEENLKDSAENLHNRITEYQNAYTVCADKLSNAINKMQPIIDKCRELNVEQQNLYQQQQALNAAIYRQNLVNQEVGNRNQILQNANWQLMNSRINLEEFEKTKPQNPTIVWQQEYAQKQQDVRDKEQAVRDAQQNVNAYAQSVQNAAAEVNNASSRVAQVQAKVNELNGQLVNLRNDYNAANGEYMTARNDYISKIDNLLTQLENYKTAYNDYRTKYSKVLQSFTDMQASVGGVILDVSDQSQKKKDAQDAKKDLVERQNNGEDVDQAQIDHYTSEINRLDAEIANAKSGNAYIGAVKTGVNTMFSGVEETLNKCSSETITEIGNQLKHIKENLPLLPSGEKITSNTSTAVGGVSIFNITENMYVTQSDMEAMMKKQCEQLLSDILVDFLESIFAFYEALFDLNLFNDGQLNAVIDTNFYNTEFGGLTGGVPSGNSAIERVIGDIKDISVYGTKVMSLSNGNFWELFSIVSDFLNLVKALVSFFMDVIAFIQEVIGNISELFGGQLYTSFYMSKTLACRTNYKSGRNMTLYPFSKIGLPESNLPNYSLVSDIAALIMMLNGSDQNVSKQYTFCGAELEYIFHGSNNETENQLYAFFGLYLLRLLLNIGPIFTNAEVESIATATTIAYPLVIVLEVIFEPLCDMILLVNGDKVPLWSFTVYLTPSGLPQFLDKLTKTAMTSEEKDNMKKQIGDKFQFEKDDYAASGNHKILDTLFSYYYEEYCFFLLLLTTPKNLQINRLKQLVWMETYNHFKDSRKFDLRKSYTYLDIKCEMIMEDRMQNVLSTNLFRSSIHEYRGY